MGGILGSRFQSVQRITQPIPRVAGHEHLVIGETTGGRLASSLEGALAVAGTAIPGGSSRAARNRKALPAPGATPSVR